MRIPFIASKQQGNGFEACCAIRVAALLKSELLKEYHYGPADERSSTTFAKLNQKHIQNAREMLLAALAPMTDATFEIRIMVVPDLLHKAQGDIEMFLLLRCFAESDELAREKTASSFLSLFPILVTYLPEANLKPVKSEGELERCCNPFESSNASAVIRRNQDVQLTSAIIQNHVGFLKSDTTASGLQDTKLRYVAPWIPSLDDWGRLLEIMTGQLEPTMGLSTE